MLKGFGVSKESKEQKSSSGNWAVGRSSSSSSPSTMCTGSSLSLTSSAGSKEDRVSVESQTEVTVVSHSSD